MALPKGGTEKDERRGYLPQTTEGSYTSDAKDLNNAPATVSNNIGLTITGINAPALIDI